MLFILLIRICFSVPLMSKLMPAINFLFVESICATNTQATAFISPRVGKANRELYWQGSDMGLCWLGSDRGLCWRGSGRELSWQGSDRGLCWQGSDRELCWQGSDMMSGNSPMLVCRRQQNFMESFSRVATVQSHSHCSVV